MHSMSHCLASVNGLASATQGTRIAPAWAVASFPFQVTFSEVHHLSFHDHDGTGMPTSPYGR